MKPAPGSGPSSDMPIGQSSDSLVPLQSKCVSLICPICDHSKFCPNSNSMWVPRKTGGAC